MNAVLQQTFRPSAGLLFFYGEEKSQESRRPSSRLRAELGTDVCRRPCTFDPTQLRPLSDRATKRQRSKAGTIESRPEVPRHNVIGEIALPAPTYHSTQSIETPALGSRPKGGASFDEATGGVNYVTRYPQGIASGLGKTHLKETEHENDAPIGENFPVEVLGTFNAIHGVGGVIETGLALGNVSKTLKAVSNRAEVNANFEKSQQALDNEPQALQDSRQDQSRVRRFCNIAQSAWGARSAKSKLEAAISQTPEHVTDAIRYTAVSWTSRVFSVLKLAFKASAWISLAASIVGVVGSAFQTVTGIFKWHSSSKAVASAKRMLHIAKTCTTQKSERAAEASTHDVQLQTHLMRHICAKRENALQKARDKRTKARIETIAGIGATIFGALAFVFPPLGFVAIGIGLAYAAYRVCKGVRSFFSTREQNRREREIRGDFTGQDFTGALNKAAQSESIDNVGTTSQDAMNLAKLNIAAENPCYAVHHLVELMQHKPMSWLHDLLAQLGIPPADRGVVFLLAQMDDTAAACCALEKMFFENDWAPAR